MNPLTGNRRPELVPRALIDLESALASLVGDSLQRLEDLLDDAFGVVMPPEDAVGIDTPLEVFPFASRGREGPHYAHVVRAPELGLVDAPVVRLDGTGRPHDFASSTAHAFSRLLAEHSEDDEDGDPEVARAVRHALRLPSLPDFNLSKVPELPSSYRLRPGLDGVGVAAPRRTFGPSPIPTDSGLSLDEIDRWSTRLLYDDLPGAALCVLKDACFAGRRRSATWTRLGSLWSRAYEALERPGLAREVRRRSARFG